MVMLTHKQISARIQAINRQLEKLDKDWLAKKISDSEYKKKRKSLIVGKQFPLQRAGMVLSNPQVYGYTKKKITISNACKLYKKFPSGGTPMTPEQFERFYGFKQTVRRKK
jgi:predicted ATP-grasp superfamily ATP-dependent carboligase